MTEDTSSLGSSIATSADDLCEAEAEEDVPTLQKTLEMLSLSEYVSTFEKERIDMESLVLKPSLHLQGLPREWGFMFGFSSCCFFPLSAHESSCKDKIMHDLKTQCSAALVFFDVVQPPSYVRHFVSCLHDFLYFL